METCPPWLIDQGDVTTRVASGLASVKSQPLSQDVDNARKDLKRLVDLGILDIWKVGRGNFYQLNSIS